MASVGIMEAGQKTVILLVMIYFNLILTVFKRVQIRAHIFQAAHIIRFLIHQ